MKRINFVGIIIILFLLVNISLVITQDKLDEAQKRLLEGDGLEITESKKIGDRTFAPIDGKGFVRTVEAQDKKIFLVGGVEITTGQNIKIKTPKNRIYVLFEDVDITTFPGEDVKYIKIVGKKGEERYKDVTVSGKKFSIKYDSKNPPKFVLDGEGNLAEGTEFETQKGKYNLRGYEIELPENSKVEYLEDGVVVTVPRGSKIKDPIRDGELKGEIEIKTDEAGPLNTPRGNFQVANKNTAGDYVSGITSLFYKWENGKMRIYTKNKVSGFFNNEGELDFTIINPSNDGEIYFVSSTKDIDASKNTVIVNDKEIGSVSVNGLGPAISIGAGSRLRGRMSELSPGGKTLSFQSKNGYAVLSNGANGDNPLIRLRGDSVYSPDGVSFTGDAKNNKFYYNPGPKIEGVTHGTGAIPINARLLDNGNKNLPYVILSNDQNQHVLAPEKDISNPAKYFVSDKGNVFSAGAVFNQLSPKGRKEFIDLFTGDQRLFVDQLKDGGNIAAIEREINKKILTNNPLSSSITLNGCSGTLVGFHNGKPMILTAAHCVRGKGSTRNVWLKDLTPGSTKSRLHKDQAIHARVVEYSKRGSGTDLALMELNPNEEQLAEIKKRGFSRIIPPSEAANLKVGAKALMIGCPGRTFYSSGCTIRGISSTTGTNSLRTNVQPVSGMSGGGLFQNGKLIGVTASGGSSYGGGFANPNSIYQLLGNKYAGLYKFFILLYN